MEALVEEGKCVVVGATVEGCGFRISWDVLLAEEAKMAEDRSHDFASLGHTKHPFQFVLGKKQFRHVSDLPD